MTAPNVATDPGSWGLCAPDCDGDHYVDQPCRLPVTGCPLRDVCHHLDDCRTPEECPYE